jgi:hypothetical protein
MIELYSNTIEASPGMPKFLADEVLDKLPQEIWSDWTKTFCDPAFANGSFYFLIIDRLMEGLSEVIGNPEERLKHIVGNQVFAYESNEVPRLFVSALAERQYNLKELNIKPNICYTNLLERKIDMKFDVVAMNPPYQAPQDAKGKRGGGDLLWHKFVYKSLDEWLKPDGLLCAVHPNGWRKPESERSKYLGMFEKMTHENHMTYLEIYDTKDGMSTFNAGTRYDWYVIDKSSGGGKTEVVGEDGVSKTLDLRLRSWLGNRDFDAIENLLGDTRSDNRVVFNVSSYETRKDWVSDKKSSVYCYPLVHSTPKKGTRYYYSSRSDKGHFGVSKVIFGETGIYSPIIDVNGEYGMTQGAMALPILDYEDGVLASKFLTSEKFENILKSCSWSNYRIDWRLFTYFKEGFWRDQ